MSDDSPNTGEGSVTWYAFFSEKHGREYYYDPNRQVVSWILPDDAHPYPDASKIDISSVSNKETERRVGFHEPVSTTLRGHALFAAEDTPVHNGSSGRGKLTVCLLLLLAAGVLALVLSALVLIYVRPNVFASEVKVQGGQKNDVASSCDMDDQNETQLDGAVLPEEHLSRREGNNVTDEAEDKGEDAEASLAEDRNLNISYGSELNSVNRVDSLIEEESDSSKLKRRCMMPFAHLVSRECRRLAREGGLFDLEGFLDHAI